MTKTKPPKGFRTPEERKKIAVDVCLMIDAAITQQGGLPKRWERNEELFRGQPIATGTEIGDTTRSVPTVGPRIKQVVANVTNPVFSVEPYFSARGYGVNGEDAKKCEKNVHFFAQRGQLDRRVKKALMIAAKADPAIIRVHFEQGQGQEEQDADTQSRQTSTYIGPTYTVIHPKNFAIYPLYTGRIEEAAFVGHRFSKRAQDIRELQAKGVYLDVESDFGNDDVQMYEAGRNKQWSLTEESSGILGDGNEQVEIWEGIVKKDLNGDGFEEYYLVQVAKTNQVLLKAEEYGTKKTVQELVYDEMGMPSVILDEFGEEDLETTSKEEFVPYSRPWYFEVSFSEPEDDEFYRSNPIAQGLQDMALIINEITNLLVDGSMMAVCPPLFTNSPHLQEATINYKMGTLNYCDDPANMKQLEISFNPGVLPNLLEYYEKKADAVVTLSQAGQGQESQGDTTATEYSGILQGQRTGMDDTRATVCTFLAPMMDFTRELIYANGETVLEYYGEELPDPDLESMSRGYTWEPMVKGGTNTPQEITMQLQTLQGFLGSLGIPPTPELILEYINIFAGALDLPTDMEKLKQAAVSAFTQQMQMQESQQGVEDAFRMGEADELNGRGDPGPTQEPGVPVPSNPMGGGQAGGPGLPGFLQQLAG